jgi:hypothetical protein
VVRLAHREAVLLFEQEAVAVVVRVRGGHIQLGDLVRSERQRQRCPQMPPAAGTQPVISAGVSS